MNSGTLTTFYCQQHGHNVHKDGDMDKAEYEKLYMPSQWVRRLPPDQAVPLHVKIVSEESERIRGSVRGQLGVRYGPGEDDLLDIFGPGAHGDDVQPGGHGGDVLVYVSGGYWQELSGPISAYPAKPQVDKGITVMVPHYTRAPTTDMQGIVDQIERAGHWIVNYAVSRSCRVWFAGHSAGSHLCALLVSSPWFHDLPPQHKKLVKGVIHLSGVFDLKPILKTSVNDALGMSPEEAENFSPINNSNLTRLAGAEAKHYIVTGEWDSPAFHQQATSYAAQLINKGVNVVTKTVPGEDHFSLVEKLRDSQYSLTKDIINWIQGENS